MCAFLIVGAVSFPSPFVLRWGTLLALGLVMTRLPEWALVVKNAKLSEEGCPEDI